MKKRYRLNILLTLYVFLVIFVTNAAISLCLIAMYLSGMIDKLHLAPLLLAIFSLSVSIIIVTVLSPFLIRYFFRPLNALTEATKRLASGDFSVQVQLEAENARYPHRLIAKSEIGMLVNSFNEMTRELGSVEIFRRDFISNFSHEFKTPLLSIRGFARQLAEADLPEAQRREFSRIIADEAEYLAGMSSDILLLTKLETQQIITDQECFSLDEQLRDCMLRFEREWSEKELHIEMELEAIRYTQNPALLSHMWNNLIANAIRFTPATGSVSVSLRETESAVTVAIEDTGIGMSEETVRHMFDKFYQADPSRQSSGNGLGLALVRRIADMTGAAIHTDSAVGRGTRITVILPKTSKFSR